MVMLRYGSAAKRKGVFNGTHVLRCVGKKRLTRMQMRVSGQG